MSNLKENIQSIILKMLQNKELKEEKDQLNSWLKESEDNIQRLNDYSEIWDVSNDKNEYIDFDTKKAWEEMDTQMTETKVISMKFLLRVAAVAAVLVAGYMFITPSTNNAGSPNENIYSAKNINENHQLPDASSIWLKEGSELTQLTDFSEERVLKLNGEAFFDVEHDPQKKFVIKTQKETVTVLGTEFLVVTEEDKFEVFVQSGRVAVNTGKRNIELNANDHLVRSNGDYTVINTINKDILSWIGSKLHYKEAPLSEVLSDLENLYEISFETSSKINLDQCLITSSFSDESIEEILLELSTIAGLEYSNNSNIYSIESVNCN